MADSKPKSIKEHAKSFGHWLWKDLFLDHFKGWLFAVLGSLFTWKQWDAIVAMGSASYSATGWQILPFLLIFVLGSAAIGLIAFKFVKELLRPNGPEFLRYIADDFDQRFGDVIWRWSWREASSRNDGPLPELPSPFCPKCWSIMRWTSGRGRVDAYNSMRRWITLVCDRCSTTTETNTPDENIEDLLIKEIGWRVDTGQWRGVIHRINPILPKG